MKVIMIGTMHNSLLSEMGLWLKIKELRAQYPAPEFVAVEYDEEVFNTKIIPLRSAIDSCKVKNKYFGENISDKELEALASCIGRDGDTHLEFYPQVKTVWLDEGRDCPENEIRFRHPCGSPLYNTISNYMAFVGALPNDTSVDDRILSYMEHEQQAPDSPLYNLERDKMWLDILTKNFSTSSSDYCLVIVGFNHTEDVEGVIRQLLERDGHDVEVHSAVE